MCGGGGVGRYKGMGSQSGKFDRTAEMGLKISIGMTDDINKFFLYLKVVGPTVGGNVSVGQL